MYICLNVYVIATSLNSSIVNNTYNLNITVYFFRGTSFLILKVNYIYIYKLTVDEYSSLIPLIFFPIYC